MSDNENIVKQLFSFLEARLFFKESFQRGQFFTLSFPAEYIDPNLDESTNQGKYGICQLSEPILDTAFTYSELTGSHRAIWQEILEFAAFPRKTLSRDQELEVEDLENWLKDNTEAYIFWAGQYEDAEAGYYGLLEDPEAQPWEIRQAKRKMDRARSQWETIGKKIEFENKQTRIIYLRSGDPLSLWQRLRQRYEDLVITYPVDNQTSIDFPLVEFYPAPSLWRLGSWTDIEFKISESQTNYSSRSTSWSAGGTGSYNLWWINASARGGSVTERYQSDARNFSGKFEVLKVRINRPWMENSLFSSRMWKWRNTHDQTLLSDGGNLSLPIPQRSIGRMPLLSTHILLVRNLELEADWGERDWEFKRNYFEAKTSVGWGSFTLGKGNYQDDQTDYRSNSKWEGNKISTKGIQLLGYYNTILPRCPFPDPTLPWEESFFRLAGTQHITDKYIEMLTTRITKEEAQYKTWAWKKNYLEEMNRTRNENIDSKIEHEFKVNLRESMEMLEQSHQETLSSLRQFHEKEEMFLEPSEENFQGKQ